MNKFERIEQFKKIKVLCSRIVQNKNDIESVKELGNVLQNTSSTVVRTLECVIFPVLFPILKTVSESNSK